MSSDAIGVPQVDGDMVQIRIYHTLGDAEYPQAVYKVLLSVAGYDNFIQHIFVTDILQTLQGIMHSKIRVLRIHTQIIFRGTTGQNPIWLYRKLL